jgi:putative inorganic carbon (HCO3(-)) transporter
VVYGAGLAAAVLFGVWLVSNSNPISSTLTPKLGSSSYALYLGFGILFVLIAPSLIENEKRRQLAYGFAVVQGALIAASQSRSLWVAMCIGLAGTALAGGLHIEAKGRLFKFGLAFVGLAVVAAIMLPSTATRLASVAHTLVRYNNPAAPTETAQVKVLDTQWRLQRWQQAYDQAVKPHPLTGIGFGVPVIDDRAIRQAYEAAGVPPPRIDPHNSFIAFAARMGIPAFFLLLLFEVMVFRSAARALRADVGPTRHALIAWLLGCQLMTAGHSLFTVVLEGPYMGLFFWLFGGMVIALDHSIRRGAEREAAA